MLGANATNCHVPVYPDDGGRRVGLHVALQIHVVLHGLVDPWSRGFDHGCELHLDVDVASVPATDAVVSDAVVRAAVLLAHVRDLQRVAPAHRTNQWAILNNNLNEIW